MTRRLTVATLAATAVAGAAAPPAPAIPPGGPRPSHNGAKVRLASTTVVPGGAIRVRGRRFPAGQKATVKLDDETILAVLPIDRRGRFAGKVAIPSSVLRIVRPGKHWLRFLAPASRANRQSNTSVQKYFVLRRR